MTEHEAFAKWRDETRAKLNSQSISIAEALTDLEAVIGDEAPPTWVDAPAGSDSPPTAVHVYVLAHGVLHHLTGWSDVRAAGMQYRSACRAYVTRITPTDTCERSVALTVLNGAAASYPPIERTWTFRVGNWDPISISVLNSSAESRHQQASDVARFAQALSDAIMTAQARAADLASFV